MPVFLVFDPEVADMLRRMGYDSTCIVEALSREDLQRESEANREALQEMAEALKETREALELPEPPFYETKTGRKSMNSVFLGLVKPLIRIFKPP